MGYLILGLEAAFAGLLLLPLFLIEKKKYFVSWSRTLWCFAFCVYLCGIYAAVGLPDIRYIRLDFHVNLVPFAYMFSDYRSTSLNVLLFLPFGFFLPVLWQRFQGCLRTAGLGLSLSLLVELLQIFTFRATDVNDLMTNTFGTFLGWVLWYLGRRFLPLPEPKENGREVFCLWAVNFAAMFFLHPLLEDAAVWLLR